MRIIEADGLLARAAGHGVERTINLALVGEMPPGTWVLVFLDSARQVLDETDALAIEAALTAVEAAAAGDSSGIEAAFADLIGREPQLPPHLRPPVD